MTDDDLYARGIATVLASWGEYARGAAGASLQRLGGVTAAVFPGEPERGILNNAVLDRDLGPAERAAAVDAMETAYGAAGIDRYAAWVHESDEGMRAELERPRLHRRGLHPRDGHVPGRRAAQRLGRRGRTARTGPSTCG